MPVVNLPAPSQEVRRSVTRLLIEMLARRALVELGLLAADNENELPR
jgi:hypothetical protein